MEQFKSFCEIISTSVENRILSWHGRNDISSIQALKMIHNGYMLGGFIISADVFHPLLIVTNTMSMITGSRSRRLNGNELKRDDEVVSAILNRDARITQILNTDVVRIEKIILTGKTELC